VFLGFEAFFARDSLPNKPKRTEYRVLNLADSSGNGTHWVAWVKKETAKTTASTVSAFSHQSN